jgi:hypothetical protein
VTGPTGREGPRVNTGAVRGSENNRPSAAARVRSRTGAVRGGDPAEIARPSNLWQVDVTRSGPVCVREGQPITFWRANAASAAELSITNPEGVAIGLQWAAGQQSLTLPAEVQLGVGRSYQLSWTGGRAPTQIEIRRLPADPSERDAVAEALMREQCRAQLDTFIAQTVVEE